MDSIEKVVRRMVNETLEEPPAFHADDVAKFLAFVDNTADTAASLRDTLRDSTLDVQNTRQVLVWRAKRDPARWNPVLAKFDAVQARVMQLREDASSTVLELWALQRVLSR